jgi:PST family polysaccharide transporter
LKEGLVASLANATTFARKRLNSSVGRNVISLYVLQFGNYVLPLATVPYLVRVLGPEKFGLVAFGQGLMAYFSLVVNYGFDWSGTRKVAIHGDNRDSVNRIAADVWGAKALLCAATAALLLILVASIPRLREAAVLLLTLYAYVLGSMLFPTWLFQGLERMSVISVTNLCVRTLGAVAIFLFIRRPGDFLTYAIVFSAQGLLAGIIGAAVAFKMFRLRLTLPSWQGVRQEIADSTPFFFTTAAISLYTSGNAFILGLLTNPVAVGYYSAAEKIVTAVAGLLGPLSQAVYPRFSRLARESRVHTFHWARKMLALTGSASLVLSVLLFVGAPLIVSIVLGPKYTPSAAVIAILSPLPVLIAVSNVLGVQLMFPFGHERKVLAIVVAAGLVNIALAFLLAPRWQASGMATAAVVSEAVVTFGYFASTWISKISPLDIS